MAIRFAPGWIQTLWKLLLQFCYNCMPGANLFERTRSFEHVRLNMFVWTCSFEHVRLNMFGRTPVLQNTRFREAGQILFRRTPVRANTCSAEHPFPRGGTNTVLQNTLVRANTQYCSAEHYRPLHYNFHNHWQLSYIFIIMQIYWPLGMIIIIT